MSHSATLLLDGICKSFGSTVALHPLTLSIEPGSLVALLGPSGCGKTTTLRIIAGFEYADSGRVLIGGRDISGLPPNRRHLGMVFQNYSLFPHMSVADNVAFGLRMARCPKAEMAGKVTKALEMVRLAGFEQRFPNQLSGGQQQRVALARSLITEPAVLLLDEPLGALDKNLRESMQFELSQLQRSLGITTLLVTHDQEEALTMSDAVAVLHEGRLLQWGAPADVYDRPNSRFVAEFLGTSNIFAATTLGVSGGCLSARTDTGTLLEVMVTTTSPPGTPITVAVRPEKLWLQTQPTEGANTFAGRIVGHVFRGTHHALQVALASNGQPVFVYLAPRDLQGMDISVGNDVWLSWRRDDAVVLAD